MQNLSTHSAIRAIDLYRLSQRWSGCAESIGLAWISIEARRIDRALRMCPEPLGSRVSV